MSSSARSQNGINIRLPEERWLHIIDEHAELAALQAEVLLAVERPERILAGHAGELMAVRPQADGKVLVAVYRELDEDGFVITAFLTRRFAALHRRTQLWPSPKSKSS